MFRVPRGGFGDIVQSEPDAVALLNNFGAFGIAGEAAILAVIEQTVTSGTPHPGYGGFYRTAPPPKPHGEPAARLLASPGTMRSGVMCTITDMAGIETVEGAAIYFSEGVQYRFQLEAVSVSEARGIGILHGTIADGFPLSVLEPSFAMDRCWHGAGSIHEILLYAVAHDISFEPMPDLNVRDRASDRPDVMREMKFSSDFSALFPALEEPANRCGIQGVVKAISSYDLMVAGQKVWRLDMTMGREIAMFGKALDVTAYVPDRVMGGSVPVVGGQCYVRGNLCARLWQANVE